MERQELQQHTGQQPVQEPERRQRRRAFAPAVDVVESPQAITLYVDMPGVDEQHVIVNLDRDVLTIQGSADWQEPDSHEPIYREYWAGDYQRSFTVTEEIDRERIEAVMKNGLLTVTLPKVAPPEAKKITVRAG